MTLFIATTAGLDRATMDGICEELLGPAFPEEELVDRETFHASYGAMAPLPGLVAFDGEKAVGVALGERHEPSGIGLLAYLAVSGTQHGRGIGSVLVERLVDIWGGDEATAALLAEVEDPRVHSATRYGDPAARMRFYRRCGARKLPIDYFQPRLESHLPRVGGMVLLSLLSHGPDLSPCALMTFLDDYLIEAEGQRPAPDDEQYARLCASVGRHGETVPTEPIEDALCG